MSGFIVSKSKLNSFISIHKFLYKVSFIEEIQSQFFRLLSIAFFIDSSENSEGIFIQGPVAFLFLYFQLINFDAVTINFQFSIL